MTRHCNIAVFFAGLFSVTLSNLAFAERLNLSQCISYALQTHPQVKLAQSQLETALAELRQAKSQLRPEVILSGIQRQQGPTVSFAIPLPPPSPPEEIEVVKSTQKIFGLDLHQNIYDGGRFTSSIRGADCLVKSANESFQATQRQLALQVTEAYINVLVNQTLEEVARQSLERVRTVLTISKSRFEAGITPKFDVLRAEAELASSEEQLLIAQNAVALAKAYLNQLLGKSPKVPLELEPLPEMMEEIEPSNIKFEPFLKQALAFRLDLKAIDWQIRSAQERVNSAKANKNPLVFFSANYQRQTETGFSRDYSWNVNLTVQIPIFDSGRRESIVQEQRALMKQILAQREQLERQINLEVEQSVRNLQVSLQRLKTAKVAIKPAQEAYRLSQVRYEAGVGTQMELLDAQLALTKARANWVQALYDAHKAFARLVYATGLTDSEVRKMLSEIR